MWLQHIFLAQYERAGEREFFIVNLPVRIHFIIVMVRWTGLAPWEFEFLLPGGLTSTMLEAHIYCTGVTRS